MFRKSEGKGSNYAGKREIYMSLFNFVNVAWTIKQSVPQLVCPGDVVIVGGGATRKSQGSK